MTICEVGPRDGLQNHPRAFTVAERIALIDRLSAVGLRRIEAVSFVSDRKVPQMAEPEAVLAGIARPPGLEVAGLVLNARGAERALACELSEIRFVVVASETFSRRNQGAGIADTLAAFAGIAPSVRQAGRRLTAVIAAAFGCPFEGVVPEVRVLDLTDRLVALGPDEIVLADTIGATTPAQVAHLLAQVRPRLKGRGLGVHFHNTRNMGFANVLAASQGGASIIDAALGGLGGCPFAPRATGNIATEDLCFMLRQDGIATGVDLPRLIDCVGWLQTLVDRPLPGMMARAGLFPEVAGEPPAPQRRSP